MEWTTRLEDEEIRLLAELDVLHERQQLASETEAKRVFDLVHVRTSLLEKELEKGQMDVEYLTHVISSAKRKKEAQGEGHGDRDAILAVVGDIRQRREDALRDATAQLQQRLHSFELEKEALRRKAEEIQWKKQRALQILSTNQQQVITGFFTTPRAAIQEANPPLPSLEFNSILETLKQPTGDIVSRLQDIEHSKAGRRQLQEALAEAERNLENGPNRLETIQQQMVERQQDALKLNITPSSKSGDGAISQDATTRAYDGAWSVETYRQDQFPVVYFVRSLLFEWMERALEISRLQPATQLLKMEIKRHVATHAVLETLEARKRLAHCAVEIRDEIEQAVVQEMAASILEELRFSADQVRGVIQKQIKDVLFVPLTQPLNTSRLVKQAAESVPTEALRWSMFGSAWEEIKHQRDADASSTRKLPRLMMRPVDKPAEALKQQAMANLMSPTKKRFGLFGGASKPAPVEMKPVPSVKLPELPASTSGTRETNEIPVHRAVLATHFAEGDVEGQNRDLKDAERILWERYVSVSESSFTSLPTCAFVSSLQLSYEGHLLAVGTLDGEVIVFTIGEDEKTMPVATRVSAADKAAGTSSALGAARITRLSFSGCARSLLSYNQLKVATLWTLAVAATTASHAPDCFTTDEKAKPLALVSVLVPLELFQEPLVPAKVLEQDAPVAAARQRAAPALVVTAFQFFPSVSLAGEPTHLICGASNGDLLNVAISSLAKKDTVKPSGGPRWLLGSTEEAGFDFPRPADSEIAISTKLAPRATTREMFRSAHSHSVIFVSSIASLPSPSPTRLVSVDQRGGVALWLYTRSSFSGFGWFAPLAVYQLDLTIPGFSTGEILQIQLTPDRKTLVLMFFAVSTPHPNGKMPTGLPGQLRFVQLDCTTDKLCVKPIRLEVSMVGTIAPRFAVIRLRQPTKPTNRPRSAAARSLPGLSPSGASFLVLLMDNALHVLSLSTGDRCGPVIPLYTKATDRRAKATRKEAALLFNSISACSHLQAARPGEPHVAAMVAVAGEQHRHIRLVRFSISHP